MDCDLPVSLANLPVQFQEPVYGSFDIEFQQYVAPGVVMTYVVALFLFYFFHCAKHTNLFDS